MPSLYLNLYTAPLHIETGRYEGLAEDERMCPMCNNGVENELHALLDCPLYDDVRKNMFTAFAAKYIGFYCFSKKEQLKIILGCNDELLVKECAKTCHNILTTRRNALYQK